jgi:hypothetical protein
MSDNWPKLEFSVAPAAVPSLAHSAELPREFAPANNSFLPAACGGRGARLAPRWVPGTISVVVAPSVIQSPSAPLESRGRTPFATVLAEGARGA